MAQIPPEQVIQHLWRPITQDADAQLYAILDAARDERVYPGLMNSGADYVCLYRGELAQELMEAAPYLVHLQPNAPFTHWLVSLGWGNSWGIFLESSVSMRDLRTHFRRFLMVYDDQGKPLYFRYYDPRVLRVYLPTCNATELQIMFGPVDCYRIEDDEGDTLLEYTCVDEQLTQRSVRLTALA